MKSKTLFVALLTCFMITGCSSRNLKSPQMNGIETTDSFVSDSWKSEYVSNNIEFESITESSGAGDYLSTQKMIYTYDIDLETMDYNQAISSIESLIAESGGYIESSNVPTLNGNTYSYYTTANYSVRIPADNITNFQSTLTSIGQITNVSKDATNVTDEYTDIESRLSTLRAKEERLLTLLDSANNMSDIIELENALNNTTYEIERYESRKLNLDKNISMSLVSITIRDVYEYSLQEEYSKDIWGQIAQNFDENWMDFKYKYTELFIAIVSGLPFFLVDILWIVIPIGIVAYVMKKYKNISFKKGLKKNK